MSVIVLDSIRFLGDCQGKGKEGVYSYGRALILHVHTVMLNLESCMWRNGYRADILSSKGMLHML